jgi:hypothetical protein
MLIIRFTAQFRPKIFINEDERTEKEKVREHRNKYTKMRDKAGEL